ncbi:MAG: hypothetical protein AB1440_27640 [Pseudomonadota bacterium]
MLLLSQQKEATAIAVTCLAGPPHDWTREALISGVEFPTMVGHGIAEPDEIAILAKAVGDFCSKHQITCVDERDRVAVKVMCLFGRGVIALDQLSIELEKVGWSDPSPAG